MLSLIRSGKIEYVHLGVPCTVWSIARRGITDWVKARKKEEVSVALTLFTVEVYRECSRCGVPVSIENPLSSKFWELFMMRELLSLPSSRFIAFDMCMYGSEYKKPTGLLTTMSELEQLGRRCCHAYRHIPAAGPVRVRDGACYRWVARTTLAGAYPPQLCSRWSRIVRASATFASFGRPRHAEDLAAKFLAELEGLVRRGTAATGHQRAAASATEQQLGGTGDSSGADSTLSAARRFLSKHRVVFGGSSGAWGGSQGETRTR